MNSFFKNVNIFLAQKSTFSKKKFEKLNIFDWNLWILWKIIFKFSIFMIPYKSREIPSGFYCQVEKII